MPPAHAWPALACTPPTTVTWRPRGGCVVSCVSLLGLESRPELDRVRDCASSCSLQMHISLGTGYIVRLVWSNSWAIEKQLVENCSQVASNSLPISELPIQKFICMEIFQEPGKQLTIVGIWAVTEINLQGERERERERERETGSYTLSAQGAKNSIRIISEMVWHQQY